jgi:hypothetical protein
MPETLTGTNNFNNQIDVPKDNAGEPRSAATLQPAFQQILDNTKNLDVRVTALLSALDNLVIVNSDDDTAILSAVQAINTHVTDVTDAHALSSISYAGNPASGLPASDSEVALDAIADRLAALEGQTRFSISGNENQVFIVPLIAGGYYQLQTIFTTVPANKSLVIKRVRWGTTGTGAGQPSFRIVSGAGSSDYNFPAGSQGQDTPNHVLNTNSTSAPISISINACIANTAASGTVDSVASMGWLIDLAIE